MDILKFKRNEFKYLKKNTRRPWAIAALIGFVIASAIAWMQPPSFKSEHYTKIDLFLNPIEINEIDRLPKIMGELRDVAVSKDGTRAIAVGEAGSILTSRDRGKHWIIRKINTKSDLHNVAISANGQLAIAVANNGNYLFSSDGGEKWISRNPLDLTSGAISLSADGRHAIAIVGLSALKKSDDGGLHWASASNEFHTELNDVAISGDGTHAVSVGSNKIFLSRDSGLNWATDIIDTDSNFTAIAISSDGKRVIAVGSEGKIIINQNSIRSWTIRALGKKLTLNDISLSADGQDAIAVGDTGEIFTSHDGGQNWTNQPSGIRSALNAVSISPDGKNAIAVGSMGEIISSSDGGKHWEPQSNFSRTYLQDIAISKDGTHVVAVGSSGSILTSIDSGRHWKIRTIGKKLDLNDIELSTDGRHAIAVGDRGAILTSDDGGENWAYRYIDSKSDLTGVAYSANGNNAVAVDPGHRRIFISNDGGKRWTPFFVNKRFYDFEISSDGKCALASTDDHSKIIISTDFGRNWIAVPRISINPYHVALSADCRYAIASGDYRPVISTDSGKHWTESKIIPNAIDYALSADGKHVISVDIFGRISTSDDYGKHWTERNSNAKVNLSKIALSADGQRAVVLGEYGIILTSQDGGLTWQNNVAGKDYSRYPAPWYYFSIALCGLMLYRAFSGKPNAAETGAAAIAASDAPASSIGQDRLGFAPLARGVSRFLRNAETRPPLTLAITGEWGSGKSSLMGQVCDDLKENGWRPVWFNAWHHQNEEQLLAALLVAVRDSGVPRILSIAGISFRLRLLLIRAQGRMLVSLLVIALASLVIALMAQHPDAQEWQGTMAFFDALQGKQYASGLTTLQSILPALGTFGVLFAIARAMRTFGVDPAVLLSSTMAKFRLKDASAQTSFRMRFAQQFGEVTDALAHPMAIVIDDLDRCEPKTVLDVMQAVNFLTSSGKCFVIFGMATQRVQAALALSFKDIAAELVQFDQVGGDERKRRQDYARDYLEKLINIEIIVPKRTDIPPSQLLEQHEKTPLAPLVGLFSEARRWWPALPIAAAIALGIWLASLMQLPEAPIPAETPPSAAQAQTAPQGEPKPETKQLQIATKPAAQPNASPILVPGDNQDVSPLWFLLALGLLALLGSVLFLIRLRQQALIVEDTQAFKEAVKIWTPVATYTRNSPRSIKRFGNRIRYLAMLQQGQRLDDKTAWAMALELAQRWTNKLASKLSKPARPDSDTDESKDDQADGLVLSEHLIVALGAMHANFGDDWRRVSSSESVGDLLDLLSAGKYELVMLINDAIGRYCKIPGASWPPSKEQLDAFERSLKGVRLPGDGRTIHSESPGEKLVPASSRQASSNPSQAALPMNDREQDGPIKRPE